MFFLPLFFTFIRCTKTLNLRTVLQNAKEEVFENTIQPPPPPPFLWFFSSSVFIRLWHNSSVWACLRLLRIGSVIFLKLQICIENGSNSFLAHYTNINDTCIKLEGGGGVMIDFLQNKLISLQKDTLLWVR